MKRHSVVPAFLSKLWTLCEDEETDVFICWSKEGNSFLVLDEQRFAKDILPKFFKHNNMASFIRQLNMYGFRKVMHMDTGLVKQERDGPVEFQHPYFKHGQDELLEHIKRKVSSSRPTEDVSLRQEDVSRLLSSVQSVQEKQEAVEDRLNTMKRENEALWREMSDLRQKHAHQQQLIKKLIHFIVTLVQNNHILNLKRKRPILMNSNGKKPKYIHQIYEEQSAVSSLNGVKGAEITDDVIICDVTQGEEPGDVTDDITESTLRVLDEDDVEMVEVEAADTADLQAHTMDGTDRRAMEPLQINKPSDSSLQINKPSGSSLQINKPSGSSLQINKPSDSSLQINKPSDSSLQINKPSDSSLQINKPSGSSLQINKPSDSSLQINKPSGGLSAEDPFIMMDSIMKESNAAISQNINLLGKVELMDYLDSIDCSLEDFQAMLFCKHFTDEDFVVSNSEQLIRDQRLETEDNTDKQLIQYTQCPLLAFLDGSAVEQQASSTAPPTELLLHSSTAPPTELLLHSSTEPPTELLLHSSTAPPTELLLHSSTAPPTELLLHSSTAPPTELLLHSSTAPPTELLLHSSTAPPTELLLHSSTAPPTELLLHSSTAPPTELLLHSSTAPPTELLLHSSTAPPTELLLHSSTAPPTELLEHSAPRSSSLIRLEPLTEAEASEETLFYLCELSPEDTAP